MGNILTTAKLISETLLFEDDFKNLIDSEFYAKLAVEIYINYGEYDQARDVAEYLKLPDQVVINNLEVDDISSSKVIQDSKLFILMVRMHFLNILHLKNCLIEQIMYAATLTILMI